MSSKNNDPKKLDWIVAVGFVLFLIALIIAVFNENLRWLGWAFLMMTIVIGFGLFNNMKNMRSDWASEGEDIEIYVPDAPESLKKATGRRITKPGQKLAYWKTMLLFIVTTILFFGLGLGLLFFELGSSF